MVAALFTTMKTKIFSVLVILLAWPVITWGGASEFPLKGHERILISVPEAIVSVQGNPSAKNLRVNLMEGAQEDYQVVVNDGVFEIRAKGSGDKESFGKWKPQKRVIEIQGPSLPLEMHLFDGQVSLQKWAKESLVHVQKGRVVLRDSMATAKIFSQTGEVQVLDHQGKVEIDAYKSNVVIRNLTGDADIENFNGETVVEKSRGFISLNQGQGVAKVLSSSGTLQFELGKGMLNSQGFLGRVEGQTGEGPVNISLGSESEVNVKSQSGRVTVQSSANSGAALNLMTQEGDIIGPAYLKVSRESTQKTLRGRLKGENQKGSIVVRTQDGAIVLK